MQGAWQNTADPELEWRLHRPFLALVLCAGVAALILYRLCYATAGAWFDWGLRTFWLVYLPLVPYIARRWRHYLEATSDVRPEAVGGRDPNRFSYWIFCGLVLPLTLILFCGQAVVFGSARLCHPTRVAVSGRVVETTAARRAKSTVTIESSTLGSVALEVPRKFETSHRVGSHASLNVTRGCLDILYYSP